MAKNYFYSITLLVFLFSLSVSAQETKQQPKTQETAVIEGLSLYPNPVSNGKVYITSKNDLDKEIIIFDVLGKKVFESKFENKINISNLNQGVYFITLISNENEKFTKKIIKE